MGRYWSLDLLDLTPKSPFRGGCKSQEVYVWPPDFSFSDRLQLHLHTCFCRGIDLSCCQGVIEKKKCHNDRSH